MSTELLASAQAVSSPGWLWAQVVTSASVGLAGHRLPGELGFGSLLLSWRVEGSTLLLSCWVILAAT